MKRILSCAALAAVMITAAACTTTPAPKMSTQSGGSNATAERTQRGVPNL